MKRLGLIVLLAAGCRHIPKADPAGVPPPWPAAPAPVKTSAPPPPAEEKKSDKPLTPPLKPEVVPPPQT